MAAKQTRKSRQSLTFLPVSKAHTIYFFLFFDNVRTSILYMYLYLRLPFYCMKEIWTNSCNLSNNVSSYINYTCYLYIFKVCQIPADKSTSYPAGDASSAVFNNDGLNNHVVYTSTDGAGTKRYTQWSSLPKITILTIHYKQKKYKNKRFKIKKNKQHHTTRTLPRSIRENGYPSIIWLKSRRAISVKEADERYYVIVIDPSQRMTDHSWHEHFNK